jgi:hypothetical protein
MYISARLLFAQVTNPKKKRKRKGQKKKKKKNLIKGYASKENATENKFPSNGIAKKIIIITCQKRKSNHVTK